MQNKTKFIKDVVHGEIVLDHAWVSEIIKCKEFIRLQKIKQLGLVYKLFPSAMHTRYGHSLGTYCLANKIIRQLDCFTKTESNELSAAALLHDLGHGPHSHAFEQYTGINHEWYSKQLILDPKTEVNKILIKYNINPQHVCDILDHKHPNSFLNDLISSQIDVDRMDYLARDSHFTGVCFGDIDASIMIKWATIQNHKICFYSKAISSIENFLLARYHMYRQAYETPKIIAMQELIKKMLARFKVLYGKKNRKVVDKYNMSVFFEPWLLNKKFTNEQYIKLDDLKFEMFIDQMQYEKDPYILEAFNLYSSFANSDYKVVLANKNNIEKYRELIGKKSKHYQLYIHKCKLATRAIYKKDDQPIWIYDDLTNQVASLDQESLIIKKLIKATKPLDVLVINNNI